MSRLGDLQREAAPAPSLTPAVATACEVVTRNCNIADAGSARDSAMCTYLLKMRELYRWEHGYPLATPLDNADIGAWLSARERLWDELEAEDFGCIPLAEGCVDPFDHRAVNRHLVPHGFVYSGGFALSGQPQFFLAGLDAVQERDEATVYISGEELARGFSAPPAMSRDESIFVRKASLRRMVWEMLEEWQWKRPPGAMADLVEAFDAERNPGGAVDRIAEGQVRTLVAHELGEAVAGRLLGRDWERLLCRLIGTRAEHHVRAVRDHLADCLRTLPEMIERGDRVSIRFYFAGFRSLRKQLFPSAHRAYEVWARGGSLDALAECCERGVGHWLRTARDLMSFVDHEGDCAALVTRHLHERACL